MRAPGAWSYIDGAWRTVRLLIPRINNAWGDDSLITLDSIIDTLYPLGSYYETTDTTFNPALAGWPGTWILESGGYTHVSAGTGYTVDSGSDYSYISYAPSLTVPGTSLTVAQMPAHTHANAGKEHKVGARKWGTGSSGATNFLWAGTNTSSVNTTDTAHRITASGTYSSKQGRGTLSITQTDAHSSSGSGNPHTHGFTGVSAHIPKLQPSIIVNRWHRMA